MKNVNPGFTLMLVGLSLSLVSLSPMAHAAIRQIDSDTLAVVDYRGKPPFERHFISPDVRPAAFARFEDLAKQDSRHQITPYRSPGPPGKSLPARRMRIGGDQKVTEFARFEEGDEALPALRRWRGAPGKGQPLLVH